MIEMRPAPSTLLGLLDRSARGDLLAFADIYDSTSTYVWRLVSYVVGDTDDAEDTAVETYEEVWRYSAHVDPDVISPLAWILSIARTCAEACVETRGRPGFSP